MHIQLVKVSNESDFKSYKAFNGGPPQNIFSVAAATPDSHHIDLFDETIGQEFKPDPKADLVGLFAATPDVMKAYGYADKLRRKGQRVVLGGLHATFLPDEAGCHADAVIIGEAEESWPRLLADLADGSLQPRYENSGPVNLDRLNPYPARFAKPYLGDMGVWSVVAARGCKFKCDYCTVHKMFPTLRKRPVGDIVDEIRASGVKYVEIHADNLIADRAYAMELIEGLKSLDINWVGEATLNITDHPDILEAAAQSGLFYLVIGLETCSRPALKNAGKGFVKLEKARESIRILHDYNIAVDSCMLFGFDEHDSSIFEETLDWVDEIEMDVVHPTILTPFPGTSLFQRLVKEDRILTSDWSKYDCSQAVFRPKQMTARELEEGVDWFNRKYHGFFKRQKRKATRARNLGWEGAYYLP